MPIPLTVQVYCSASGRSPVLDWLEDLTDGEFKHCVAALELLEEHGPELAMPISRPVGKGFYELRPHVGNVQLRLLYFFRAGAIAVVAAGFVKKGPAMLDRVRKLAEARRREVEQDPTRHTLSISPDKLRQKGTKNQR